MLQFHWSEAISKQDRGKSASEPKDTTGASQNISSSKGNQCFPLGVRLHCRGGLLTPPRAAAGPRSLTGRAGVRALSARAATQHGRHATGQMLALIFKLRSHRMALKPPPPSLPRRPRCPRAGRKAREELPGPPRSRLLRCRHAGGPFGLQRFPCPKPCPCCFAFTTQKQLKALQSRDT